MIAGTSIGALVGGCYLAGKLDEIESFARSLTMRRIASLLDLTIGGSGLFGGMRLTKRMQEHLEGLTKLKNVNLIRTQVSEKGVKKLKAALPNASISTRP